MVPNRAKHHMYTNKGTLNENLIFGAVLPVAYLELSRTSTMNVFAKLVKIR